jgi:hypothetical protein
LAPPPINRKRAPRIDVRRSAVLINSDGAASAAVILDVSSGGFRLITEDVPRISEFVTLRVEHDEEFFAQIRWVLGSEVGGTFLTPVDYARLGMKQGGAVMADEQDSDRGADRSVADDQRQTDRRTGTDRRQSPRGPDDRRKEERRGS